MWTVYVHSILSTWTVTTTYLFFYFFNGKRCRENKASQYLQKFIFGIMSVIGQPLVSLPGLNFPSFHCSQIYRYVGAKAGWSMRLTLYRVGVRKCSSQTPYIQDVLSARPHTYFSTQNKKKTISATIHVWLQMCIYVLI